MCVCVCVCVCVCAYCVCVRGGKSGVKCTCTCMCPEEGVHIFILNSKLIPSITTPQDAHKRLVLQL